MVLVKELKTFVQERFGLNLFNTPTELLPDSQEELDLHMQINYKQAVEIAEEQALNVLLEGNKYELIKKRVYYDLTVLGIGAIKTNFNTSEGVTIEYVDPENLVYSYTDSPYFEDVYYVGEVKDIPVNELTKQFPYLSEEDLEDAVSKTTNGGLGSLTNHEKEDNKVRILYFNYKCSFRF